MWVIASSTGRPTEQFNLFQQWIDISGKIWDGRQFVQTNIQGHYTQFAQQAWIPIVDLPTIVSTEEREQNCTVDHSTAPFWEFTHDETKDLSLTWEEIMDCIQREAYNLTHSLQKILQQRGLSMTITFSDAFEFLLGFLEFVHGELIMSFNLYYYDPSIKITIIGKVNGKMSKTKKQKIQW